MAGDSLGRLVEVVVDTDESGDHGNLNILTGNIIGTILDEDKVEYHIIETDDKGFFLVIPRAAGLTLDWVCMNKDEDVWVAIGRVLDDSIVGKTNFKSPDAEFYAIGTLKFL